MKFGPDLEVQAYAWSNPCFCYFNVRWFAPPLQRI